MNGHALRERREKLGVCVEAVAEAVDLDTSTIEYVERWGHDYTWVIEPAMAYLDRVETERMQAQAAEPSYCIAMGAPYLAHCAECISNPEPVSP